MEVPVAMMTEVARVMGGRREGRVPCEDDADNEDEEEAEVEEEEEEDDVEVDDEEVDDVDDVDDEEVDDVANETNCTVTKGIMSFRIQASKSVTTGCDRSLAWASVTRDTTLARTAR